MLLKQVDKLNGKLILGELVLLHSRLSSLPSKIFDWSDDKCHSLSKYIILLFLQIVVNLLNTLYNYFI